MHAHAYYIYILCYYMYIHIANGTGSTPCRRARALETVGATGSETLLEIAAVGPKMGRYPEEIRISCRFHVE
jgi:hypothetical protein